MTQIINGNLPVDTNIDNIIAALATCNKGATSPTYAQAGMLWVDDSVEPQILKLYDGSDWIEIGDIDTVNNRFIVANAKGALNQMLHVQDQRSSGINGDNATGGVYQTRTLNSVLNNEIGAVLSNNQIILQKGSYYVEWSAPAWSTTNNKIARHKTRLQQVSQVSETKVIGSSEYVEGDHGYPVQTRSFGAGAFTIASDNILLELQHRVEGSEATGFGRASGFGDNEVYADLRIWKLD